MTEEAVAGAAAPADRAESPDGAAAAGRELARAREALGLTIADAAQQLKFAPRQLEALEAGRFGELPAGAFARGMVRAYARLLRLDPAPLLARVAERTAAPDNAAVIAAARAPIPITDSARRTNLAYAALSAVFLAVIAGVVIEWRRDAGAPEEMTFVPAARPAPEAAAPAPQVASAAPVLAVRSAEAPAAASPAPAAATPGARRLQFRFDGLSWVEVKGRDGRVLLSQLNSGGTERTVEGQPPFALIIGNARFVRLAYDDRPVDLAPYVKVEVARFTLD